MWLEATLTSTIYINSIILSCHSDQNVLILGPCFLILFLHPVLFLSKEIDSLGLCDAVSSAYESGSKEVRAVVANLQDFYSSEAMAFLTWIRG